MKKVSLIIPCFNEADGLPEFDKEINRMVSNLSDYCFEIIYVDDGSTDNTLQTIRKFSKEQEAVKYISFSRNFGKEAAMYAGFCNATGDYVAVMDADLQDPPALLPDMLKILESGEYDSVATRRVSRKGEPVIRSFCARQFYKLINRISDADIVDGARDYRLMTRDMTDAIVALGERNRFSKGIYGWIGYRTYWYPYENVQRIAGETKWSFWKLLKYSIQGIVDFSDAPLAVASWFGISCTGISFLALLFIIIRRLVFGDPVAGWASTVCIIVFIGGIQLFCLGVIGQYIGRTYTETKRRPHYIISDSSEKDIEKIG